MSIVGYGLGRDIDVADFTVGFGFGILQIIAFNPSTIATYIILEEVRLFEIGRENRIRAIDIQERGDTIYYEDRILVIPQKLD